MREHVRNEEMYQCQFLRTGETQRSKGDQAIACKDRKEPLRAANQVQVFSFAKTHLKFTFILFLL